MKRVYLTTPIYYVTDPPHLGHAYTTVVADALARYHRLRGRPTRFLTGTDEHGQKVERIAADRGKTAGEYAAEISQRYRDAWKRLDISNDDFIRTTDKDHEAVVIDLWRRMQARGDVYLDHYEGPYCVACEQFYTEKELGPGNLCPVHGKPIEILKEESYFFKLADYKPKLQQFYDKVLATTGKPFVEPAVRMNEVRAFVDGDVLNLSASRTTFTWGIPVEGHERHIIYVWFDALINYYSATRRSEEAKQFWPDRKTDDPYESDEDIQIVHLMGKEITRFHAVYWPAMLMSSGVRLPTKIIAHGWWTVDGEKMSKTRGNVVDPLRLVDDLDQATGAPVGVDAFRYFVLREVPLGVDGDFSHAALLNRYNAELANDLGNLLNRTLGMVTRYFGTSLAGSGAGLKSEADGHRGAFERFMEEAAPSKALDALWLFVRYLNTYIEQSAPWKQDKAKQAEVLWNVLESCRYLSHLLAPFMPERAAVMRAQLGVVEPAGWPEWSAERSFEIRPGTPLFPRLDEDKKQVLLGQWSPPPTSDAAQQEGAALQQSPSPPTAAAPAATQYKSPIAYEDFAKLDLRVARIAAAEKLPKKDKLLKLTVDLGGETRTVIAGIAAAYPPADLVGRSVIFLANLKPAKIGGVLSEGMILAAGDPDVIGLSTLDRDCLPGTKVK